MADGAILLATCSTCSKIRYRSKFPITKVEDAKSENFEPVNGAPLVTGDAPPMCHECGSMLQFGTEVAEPKEPIRLERMGRAAPGATAAKAQARFRTLFQTDEGEQIMDIRGQFVITNRRIIEYS